MCPTICTARRKSYHPVRFRQGTCTCSKASALPIFLREVLKDWFDCWLKGRTTSYVEGAPIKLFILGDNCWRERYRPTHPPSLPADSDPVSDICPDQDLHLGRGWKDHTDTDRRVPLRVLLPTGTRFLSAYSHVLCCADTDFVCKVSVVHPDGKAYSIGSHLVRARFRNGEKAEFLTPPTGTRFLSAYSHVLCCADSRTHTSSWPRAIHTR